MWSSLFFLIPIMLMYLYTIAAKYGCLNRNVQHPLLFLGSSWDGVATHCFRSDQLPSAPLPRRSFNFIQSLDYATSSDQCASLGFDYLCSLTKEKGFELISKVDGRI